MQPPEKRYGIGVNPLRVLIDPTALPREGFRVNRIIGLILSGEEASAVFASVLGAVITEKYEIGIYTYLLIRLAAAAATYMVRG